MKYRKKPTAINPLEHVVMRDFDAVIEFVDFCIGRDKSTKLELEVMFMYYVKQKIKSA